MATKTRQLSDYLVEGGLSDVRSPEKPHIDPGTLQPAIAGKLLDGSTNHSGAYGTAQSDGHSYYYTDIKGSTPIKDPRIGAHFGSQRHKFKSLQLLEQETAAQGQKVWSIDGRKWARAVGKNQVMVYDTNGNYVRFDGNQTTHFYEFVCYCSSLNMILECAPSNRHTEVSIDGGSETSFDNAETTPNSPLKSRFVDAGSLCSVVTGQTLGIHTIKIRTEDGSDRVQIYGIEPIVQDTTSTATKSKIQIPAQTVVSYGKKFSLSAASHHYNPFAFAGDGTTAVAIGDTTSHGKVADGWSGSTATYFDSTLDTATSLGLSAWEYGGNFYRPVNGGRIVKWIASDGTIKTSVNMMPPTGQSIDNTGGDSGSTHNDGTLPTSHAWTTVYQDKLVSGTIDHSQSEVAKRFYGREFGNGSANGGTGATYADYSTLSTTDSVAYTMDDGLTSLVGNDVSSDGEICGSLGPNESNYITFIGTGITWSGGTYGGTWPHEITIAQNLFYGTHIVRLLRDSNSRMIAILDGKYIYNKAVDNANYFPNIIELSFHQPKMPPIPEDACIISDYMLMADFVPQTTASTANISKGVRFCHATRDVFYNGAGSFTTTAVDPAHPGGIYIYRDSESTVLSRMTAFSTNAIKLAYNAAARKQNWYTNDTSHSSADSTTHNGSGYGAYYYPTAATALGNNVYDQYGAGSSALHTNGFQIVSPTHTSSHYQRFETPFLHELVGGDRNMEQTNLVVTPDGKTWDEVTRDTSYIGSTVANLNGSQSTSGIGTSNAIQFKLHRGREGANAGADLQDYFMKENFVFAFDRIICLIDGEYLFSWASILGNAVSVTSSFLKINGTNCTSLYTNDAGSSYWRLRNELVLNLRRGDYVQIFGGYIAANNPQHSSFSINKIVQ